MPNTAAAPVVLLLGVPFAMAETLRRAAARADWQCLAHDPDARWPAADRPAVIVAGAQGIAAAARIRDASAPGAALFAAAEGLVPPADEALPLNASDEACDALLARLRPPPLPDAVSRQLETFGPDHLLPLIERLRDRLARSVSPDTAPSRADAHQLAGIAGILGFAEVSSAWQAASISDDSRLDDARRITRKALVCIDHSGLCT